MRKLTHLFFGLVFSFLLLSISTTAQTTLNICLGESIALPDFPDFPTPPQGPAGPDGMLPFNCTPQITAVTISPIEGAVVNDLQNLVLSPTESTTYTVVLSGACGAPGVGLITNELTFTYEVIVDQNCTTNITEVFTICSGESVQLPAEQIFPMPPQGPVGSNTPCTPRLTEININPTSNAVANGTTDFTVSPTTSTIYEVTSSGFCGAPGIGSNSNEITRRYAVLIDQDCSTGGGEASSIFTDFPWVSSLVNPMDCTIESIQVYQQGIFSFLLITNEFGDASLYFQDGQFYCQNAANFDCVAAYGFGTPISTWNCGDLTAPAPDCARFSGQVFFEECDDNGLFYFIRLTDGRVIDPYFADGVNFTPEEGQQVNFDYVLADFATPCSIAEAAVLLTCIEEIVPDIAGDGAIFSEFPWLAQLINPNGCNGERVSIYQSGIFQFVFVETSTEGVLYFEDGTRYCMDAPNYDCRALYNLGEPINTWACGARFNVLPSTNITTPIQEAPTTFTAYPNPSTGPLTVQLSGELQKVQQLRLYDLYGRLLQEIQLTNNSSQQTIPLDISRYAKGIYLLEWQSGDVRKVEKIIKE